ncbi:EpsG family protein [Anianabacter salinae]|uniref:EpsG family protein n=1 Tax=Anianabacter salinae TaxID=2851023 RepID=UPI00225E3E5D|nr:EpsG family protein [Anianabacter salinae]MBV0913469.1 EpsG family protein [Anianabacter salinae]
MIVYWSMVAIPAFFALGEQRGTRDRTLEILVFLTLGALWLILAFRQTGGDYSTYLILFHQLAEQPLYVAMFWTEPLYGLLNWTMAQAGLGMSCVNGACSLIFFYGLWRFVRIQPYPYLVLSLSVPYLVIVVAMGYTRQGVATGLIMLGLCFLMERRLLPFVLSVVAATGFHSSAAIALPLLLLADLEFRSKLLERMTKLATVLIGLAGLLQSVAAQFGDYVEFYVESDRYQSGGAVLRASVTAAAALAFVFYRSDWKAEFRDYRIFYGFSIVALAMIPLAFIQSTAADRIGLYLIPYQIAVFGRLPVLQRAGFDATLMKLGVLLAYLLYFFTWLHLGSFSQLLWVPYRSELF